MMQYWLVLLIAVVVQIIATFLLREFPNLLGDVIRKSIEHRNDKALEKIRADLSRETAKDVENLRAEYASLSGSAAYLAANQAELRARMIQASDMLWKAMMQLRADFGNVVYLETILLPSELAELFERGQHKHLRGTLAGVEDERYALTKMSAATTREVEACRLFVGGKTWYLFYVYRAILARVAYKTHISLSKSKYQDWRTDEPILKMLGDVLPANTVDGILRSSLPSLQLVLDQLEARFLREAMRTMVGSTTLADNISDVQATMALETTRVRETEQERQVKP